MPFSIGRDFPLVNSIGNTSQVRLRSKSSFSSRNTQPPATTSRTQKHRDIVSSKAKSSSSSMTQIIPRSRSSHFLTLHKLSDNNSEVGEQVRQKQRQEREKAFEEGMERMEDIGDMEERFVTVPPNPLPKELMEGSKTAGSSGDVSGVVGNGRKTEEKREGEGGEREQGTGSNAGDASKYSRTSIHKFSRNISLNIHKSTYSRKTSRASKTPIPSNQSTSPYKKKFYQLKMKERVEVTESSEEIESLEGLTEGLENLQRLEELDAFEFCSTKLRNLRKHNCRMNRSPPVPPQAMEDMGKLTVVLDVDETLIHSKISPGCRSIRKAKQDMREGEAGSRSQRRDTEDVNVDEFEMVLSDGEVVRVLKRPGLDEFLKHAGGRYEIMAYTAGLKQYAQPLLNWLDPENKIFKHRFYRDSCLFSYGYYLKDLKKVNRNLARTVLVDNNLVCFLPQLENGIPISSFYDDPKDDALTVLKNYLQNLDCESDVRPFLNKSFNLVNALSNTRKMVLE